MGVKKNTLLCTPSPRILGKWGRGRGEFIPPPRARIGLGINNSVLKYLSHWPKKNAQIAFSM